MSNTIRIKRGTTEPTAGVLVTGELAIDTTDGSLYSKLDDGSVTNVLAKASRLSASVRNESGSAISAFNVVYISGASSNKALISLAQADSEATSSKTFGVTTSSISNNNNGEVVCVGLLSKVDTSSFTAGDSLWLSPTTAGAVTTTKPSAPNHAVFIGTVTRSHATQGTVEVRIQNGYEIQELHNVSITTPANGEVLTYNSSTGLWYNAAPSGGGGGGTWGSITGTLSDQTDLQSALDAKAPSSSPTFTGDVTTDGNLKSTHSSGDEGGEIQLAIPQTNTTISSGVTIDIYQNKVRIFESGGNNRGAYIDLTAASNGVGSDLLAGGGGGAAAIPVYDNGVTYSVGNQVIYSDRFWYMSNYVGAAGYDPIGYPAYWTEISPYVDTGITDAPSDGTQYVRQNGSWTANSGFTFSDSPSDGNYYVRMGATGWAQIGSGTDTIATQNYVTNQGYATTTDVTNAVSGLVSTADARKQAFVESARAVLNDSAYGFDGSGYYYTSFMSGAFNYTVTNSQFSSGGKWFGFKQSGTVYSAFSVSLSSGVVTITSSQSTTPDVGTGLFYTEDGGTTWFESTIPISA